MPSLRHDTSGRRQPRRSAHASGGRRPAAASRPCHAVGHRVGEARVPPRQVGQQFHWFMTSYRRNPRLGEPGRCRCRACLDSFRRFRRARPWPGPQRARGPVHIDHTRTGLAATAAGADPRGCPATRRRRHQQLVDVRFPSGPVPPPVPEIVRCESGSSPRTRIGVVNTIADQAEAVRRIFTRGRPSAAA